jgi:outer membrane lipoprotein-sorting protein
MGARNPYHDGVFRIVLALTWAYLAIAQETPPAIEELHRVSDLYAKASRYHLAGDVTITVSNQSGGSVLSQDRHSFIIAMQKPDKVRVEMTPTEGEEAMYIVSDGQSAWAYSPTRNEYMSLDVPKGAPKPVAESEVSETNAVLYALQLASQATELFGRVSSAERAEITRQERVVVGGSSADCYVIVIEGMPSPKSSTTWWVDKQRHVVLREELRSEAGLTKETMDTTYTTVRVDEALPEGLFVFTPPPNARRVNSFRQ